MANHAEHVSKVADLALENSGGIGAVGVGIGAAQAFDVFQSALVSVGSICGAILVIWTLYEKIRQTIKRRKAERND